MQFSSKEDFDAPADEVFRLLSDFRTFEAEAVARGLDLTVPENRQPEQVGQQWVARFKFRGKQRQASIRLTQYDPSEQMRFDINAGGISGTFSIDLIPLSPQRTRMAVVLHLAPRTVPARILVQSLRLQKARLNRRFKLRVAQRVHDLDKRMTSRTLPPVTKS